MSTEISMDPYTLVAHHLREGEFTRAQLKAATGLDYAQIEAALYQLAEVSETVSVRTDPAGIDHYRWKDEAKMIDEPQVRQPKASTNGSRFGIRVGPEIKKIVEALPVGTETDTPRLFSALLAAHPKLKANTDHATLRTYISQAVSPLKGKSLTLFRKGKGPEPDVYCRILGNNGQVSPPKSGQETAKIKTTSEAVSRQSESLQLVKQDNSQDTIVAEISVSPETTNRASYALPSFIAELRGERDELDLLIALLEKRILRGGGGVTDLEQHES